MTKALHVFSSVVADCRRRCAVAVIAVLCSWTSCAYAEPGFTGTYSVPFLPAKGTVLLRDYLSSQDMCYWRPTCTARNITLLDRYGGGDGPLIPTSVQGISVQMLINGKPVTNGDSIKGTVIDKPVELQLVADGRPIIGGSLKSLNTWRVYFTFNSMEASTVTNTDLTGTITAIQGTCSVPSQTVTLPSITARKFNAVGSLLGTQSFQLRVNSCPKGYNQVGYSLSPVGGVVAGAPGILPLSAESTTRGVKVHIADSNGTPVPFGKSIKVDAYNKATGGSYAVPMQASYIQTDAAVTPGTVKAAMSVTLEYR